MQESVARNRTETTPKRRRPKKQKKWSRILLLVCLFLFLAAGGTAAAFLLKMDEAIGNVTNDPYQLPSTEKAESAYHADKPLSIVLLGRDTRKETGSLNTDVMIVAVVNPQTKKVTMVSLPRDTRVSIPGYRGMYKINAVYANGEVERRRAEARNEVVTENGITLTKKTLENMLGIPIQHYIEMDFVGFKAVIDELGGVEINVERKLLYHDPTDGTSIDLEPGLQVLNGEQALGYVRHRHDDRGYKYESSDFDRNRRQQEVIKAVVDKVMSFEGLTKIFHVIDVASQHIHTDLSKEQIKGLVYDFRNFSSANIVTLENGAYWKSGYTFLPKEKLEAIRASLQNEMGVTATAELSDTAVADSRTTESAASAAPRQTKKAQQPKPTDSAKKATPSETVDSAKKGSNAKPTDTGSKAEPASGGEQVHQPDSPDSGKPGNATGGQANQPGEGDRGEQEQAPAPSPVAPPPDIPILPGTQPDVNAPLEESADVSAIPKPAEHS